MSKESNENVKYFESLSSQAELLKAASSMKSGEGKTNRDEPIRRILARSASIISGVALLGKEVNTVSIGILARALLENLIVILWVQISEENAEHFLASGIAELSKVAKLNLESGLAKIKNKETGQDHTKEFLESDLFKRRNVRHSVESRAREAGVEDLYNIFYRYFSLEMHGHEFTHSVGKENELTQIHLQGIGAIGKAIGHSGVNWLIHRKRTENTTLRELLGLTQSRP